MNERSSRSHSVFTLKVKGVNPLTGEQCEAMLNLGELFRLMAVLTARQPLPWRYDSAETTVSGC